MKDVLDVSWIYRGAQAQYAYCDWNSSQYTNFGEDCAICLQEQEGGVIIGNFADTMLNACASQPLAANGEIVSTARDLFNSATIASTSGTSSSTSASASSANSATTTAGNSAISTVSSVSSPTISPSNAAESGGGLSPGASIGLGVGIGIVGLAAVIGVVFFVWRKRSVSGSSAASDTILPPHHLAQEIGVHPDPIEADNKAKLSISEMEARNTWPVQELEATGKLQDVKINKQ